MDVSVQCGFRSCSYQRVVSMLVVIMNLVSETSSFRLHSARSMLTNDENCEQDMNILSKREIVLTIFESDTMILCFNTSMISERKSWWVQKCHRKAEVHQGQSNVSNRRAKRTQTLKIEAVVGDLRLGIQAIRKVLNKQNVLIVADALEVQIWVENPAGKHQIERDLSVWNMPWAQPVRTCRQPARHGVWVLQYGYEIRVRREMFDRDRQREGGV